jgi:pyridoxal phosphate enzyme (YggS family)
LEKRLLNDMGVRDNLAQLRRRLEAAARQGGHSAEEITLVGVTKTVDEARIREAYALGVVEFGENRADELARKQPLFPDAVWHMIGRLQANKVRTAVRHAALIHSLDRWSLALEINKRSEQAGRVTPCLVQLNLAGEPQKGGLAELELGPFLEKVSTLPFVRVEGLMLIAPAELQTDADWEIFKKMKKIFDSFRHTRYNGVVMNHLSMGMSGDFEAAVAAGANMVRIGSALFKDA